MPTPESLHRKLVNSYVCAKDVITTSISPHSGTVKDRSKSRISKNKAGYKRRKK